MPEEINKGALIDQYLRTEKILRDFFDTYTISICVGHCVETGTGQNCCEDQDFHITEVNVELIGQDIMKRRSAEYKKVSSEGCGYLSPYGCILKEYRSPICNTFVCEEMEEYFERLSPGLGCELKGIEKLAVGIFKGLPDSQDGKVSKLEDMVSNLSRKIDSILPPNTSVWDYVTKVWRVK
jgi:hypothetical protein